MHWGLAPRGPARSLLRRAAPTGIGHSKLPRDGEALARTHLPGRGGPTARIGKACAVPEATATAPNLCFKHFNEHQPLKMVLNERRASGSRIGNKEQKLLPGFAAVWDGMGKENHRVL